MQDVRDLDWNLSQQFVTLILDAPLRDSTEKGSKVTVLRRASLSSRVSRKDPPHSGTHDYMAAILVSSVDYTTKDVVILVLDHGLCDVHLAPEVLGNKPETFAGESHEWKGWTFKMRQYIAAVDEELFEKLRRRFLEEWEPAHRGRY